ncbi:hypothetical protein GCM10011430_27630 [Oxalicibacterium solurbis]|uniref:Uncharacterized protein n=1 Tax=Oxalicibacterium solurbis TaxID=69280 RepID=A0A8J3B662_9BURK|nr:hypothetical protein GCM10011430_27630 [Oxalicibacterium solurbis]
MHRCSPYVHDTERYVSGESDTAATICKKTLPDEGSHLGMSEKFPVGKIFPAWRNDGAHM